MSLRQLVEGDCGGANPLMQLGGQFTRDAARKDEGFTNAQFERSMQPDEEMVNEFIGQVAGPAQSFQMETLLQEMREIEYARQQHLQPAPRVIDEVTGGTGGQWATDFNKQQLHPISVAGGNVEMMDMQPQQQRLTNVREFFDNDESASGSSLMSGPPSMVYASLPQPYSAISPPHPQAMINSNISIPATTNQFFAAQNASQNGSMVNEKHVSNEVENESFKSWMEEYEKIKEVQEATTATYNEKFWLRLQEEWQKLSEETDHPWLSEYNESYDPYTEYEFAEQNPMAELENAFEKGKEYLAKGDVPSAVLCFEVAAKKDPENADIWEHLGMSQAENEMDPQGIAALRRSLSLKPDNMRVLMALAVCYTNESLQSHALRMLINWIRVNPKYAMLLNSHPELQKLIGGVNGEAAADGASTTGYASSLIYGNKLQEVQNLFLEAVRMQPQEVDADVQEALGVLYNLSSEFDKAADCFRAALSVNPRNAKVWNRLGASLANGSRSVEAVEAYQQALQLEPGFIRVRYNIGVCCMNLKAFKQAVEHLLTALNMQKNSAVLREFPSGAHNFGNSHKQMSDSIWSTLKMIISLIGRKDLHGSVNERNLTALNEAFSWF